MKKSGRKRGMALTDQGLQKLRQAIRQAEDAEQYGDRFTREDLSDRVRRNETTIRKILNQQKVQRSSIQDFFDAFHLTLEDEDIEYLSNPHHSPPPLLAHSSRSTHTDWGEAVDVSIFYGRVAELQTLNQWILGDRCRLVALLGMGGIGKTALSVKLSEDIQSEFDYLIWRSLREAPPVEKILSDLIKFLSDQQEIDRADTVGESVTRLIHYLNGSRCLVVLDNVESILQGGTQAGRYRDGYDGYGTLFQRVGEARHQSCLVLTSREKPGEVARQEGMRRKVRSLPLPGLEARAGQAFLVAEGLNDGESHWKQVLDYYSGNPLALKIAANMIQDLFGGDVDAFLAQGTGLFSDIRDLLEQQFERLSKMGQTVMYWLAINREPTSINELKEDILDPISTPQLLDTLESLRKRSLIERTEEGFTLQNVVMEYLTERFTSTIIKELQTQQFDLFHTHALMKATAKDYVRETQERLIAKIVSERINNQEEFIQKSLNTIRQFPDKKHCYSGGNLLNLSRELRLSLRRSDFSNLALWQTDFRRLRLSSSNLAGANVSKSAFCEVIGDVLTVAYSPKGDLIAASDSNGKLYIWTTDDMVKQHTFSLSGGWIRTIAFSPDQKILVTGDDHDVWIWDLKQGKLEQRIQKHKGWVRSVCFALEGRIIASSSDDGTVKLWDRETERALEPLQSHTARVRTITWNPSQNILASGGDDGLICLWEIKVESDINEISCNLTRKIHDRYPIRCIVFHPHNEDIFVTSSDDKVIRKWEKIRNKVNFYSIEVATLDNWTQTLAFSDDGFYLASGGDDSYIRIWDISTCTCITKMAGHYSRIWSLSFCPKTKILVSGSDDETLKFWDIEKGKCFKTIQGFVRGIRSIMFHPTQPWIVSAGDNKRIGINPWGKQSSDSEPKSFWGHKGRIWSVAIHPNGQWMASASDDKTVRIWNFETGESITLKGHNDYIRAVDFGFHPKKNHIILASASDDFTIKLWDIESGQCFKTLKQHNDWVRSITFSKGKEQSLLASGSYGEILSESECNIKIFDLNTEKTLKLNSGPTNGLRCLEFSPDSTVLASSGEDKLVCLWDVKTLDCIMSLSHHNERVWSISFSSDGLTFATGSDDKTVQVCEIKTGKVIVVLPVHEQKIRSVAFSPDGKILAAGGTQGTIFYWDVTENYRFLGTMTNFKPFESVCIKDLAGVTPAQTSDLLELGAILTFPAKY